MGLSDALAGSAPGSVPEIQRDTPHYEAVGRFVTSFANAEGAVHMLARHLSGLSDEKARIIFGGMRLLDVSNIIREIAKIDKLASDIFEVINGCLTQLGRIANRRNIIVHRSSAFFDGKLFATNHSTAKSIKAIESNFFDVEELSDMQADCQQIWLRLARIFLPEPDPTNTAALEAIIYGRPWRYKYVPPKTPNLKPRARSAKQKP